MMNAVFDDFFDESRFDFISCPDITSFSICQGQKEMQSLTLIPSCVIQKLCQMAFSRLSFCFEKKYLTQLIDACLCPNASCNDRFVLATLLQNADIAAKGKLPICQDTGIANIFGFKDNGIVITQGSEEKAMEDAVETVYQNRHLRFSTVLAKDFFCEYDPKNNLPCQIEIFSGETFLDFEKTREENSSFQNDACPIYRLLFCAKGGGSSNKTMFFQKTKALLNKESLLSFLKENVKKLGTSACPPYHICVVVGGTSPEENLLTLKLATCGVFTAPIDKELSKATMDIANNTKLGCQFGGNIFCIDAKVLRLSRHAASCPVSIGVSCCAHRNLQAAITQKGIYLQKVVKNPSSLPHFLDAVSFLKQEQRIKINTDGGMKNTLSLLHPLCCGTRVSISGHIIVARDAAHAKWQELLNEGKPLPKYIAQYPICYAGPSQTPEGFVIGSFGPTTSNRMDIYARPLMQKGASLVSIAKGNRSREFISCLKDNGGIYLGAIGGAAAFIAQNNIKSQKIIDYQELGMEAVRLLEVEDLTCFVVTDDKGNDFYQNIYQDLE